MLEAVSEMTVLELSEFVKAFEEKFGVSAAAPVAVAGVDENRQVWPGHFHTFGDRQGATVDAVKTIGLHVVRKAARTTNSRDEHRFLRCQGFVTAQPLHGGQNGVVATPGTPAWHAALIVFKLKVRVTHLQQALCGGHHIHAVFTFLYFYFFSCFNSTARIVLGLIGWPRT